MEKQVPTTMRQSMLANKTDRRVKSGGKPKSCKDVFQFP
jgi:hypothetical protein